MKQSPEWFKVRYIIQVEHYVTFYFILNKNSKIQKKMFEEAEWDL